MIYITFPPADLTGEGSEGEREREGESRRESQCKKRVKREEIFSALYNCSHNLTFDVNHLIDNKAFK